MTSLITLGGILVLLGLGFWWAVNKGKRLNQAKSLRERVDKVANVNEYNRREDEKLNRQVQNAEDNPSPVRAPWLRKRN
jgi:hypothetical protein